MNKPLVDHLVKESIHSYFFNPKMKDSSIQSDLQELTQVVKKLSKKKHYVVFIVEDKVY
jgi:hypothetical protein